MKNTTVELEKDDVRRVTCFARKNNLTTGEVVGLAIRRLLAERHNHGLSVLCEGDQLHSFKMTPRQMGCLNAVAETMGTNPAVALACLGFRLLDSCERDPRHAHENANDLWLSFEQYAQKRQAPTLPALPPPTVARPVNDERPRHRASASPKTKRLYRFRLSPPVRRVACDRAKAIGMGRDVSAYVEALIRLNNPDVFPEYRFIVSQTVHNSDSHQ